MLTIIRGPRGTGKTTIAKMLAYFYMTIDQANVIVLDDYSPETQECFLLSNLVSNATRFLKAKIDIEEAQRKYDMVILVLKPGSKGQAVYTKPKNGTPFLIETDGGYNIDKWYTQNTLETCTT